MENKELKLDGLVAIQRKAAILARNRKAEEYSAKVAQKRKAKYRKEIKNICVCCLILLLCGSIFATCVPERTVTVDVIGTHIEYEDYKATNYLVCRMPNGEIHEYVVENGTKGIKSVILDTKWSKDYEKYEIVDMD